MLHNLEHGQNHLSCSWWNSECDKLVTLRNDALGKFKISRSWIDFNNFKKAKAKARINFRKIKTDNFRTFCKSLKRKIWILPGYLEGCKRIQKRWNFQETKVFEII